MRGPQNGYDYDDDDDKQSRKSGPVHDGDAFEDIYSHYATPTPSPNSAAQPPSYIPQIHSSNQQDVQRNFSKSNQSVTTSASRWGKWDSSKAALNDSQSTFKSKHLGGSHSISKRTLPLSSPAAKKFGWLPQTWATRLFLLVTVLEAAADVSIEAMLLSRFRRQQGSIMDADGNVSALPVFVMVFGMAHLYQCFLAIDSVVNRNTILVFGLVVFNSAFLIYAVIQISEIRNVLGDGIVAGASQHIPVEILTGAIPVIIGCASLAFAILAWFLWKDFGWQIYKVIGADRNLKKAHMHYQIFVCLLKFDFFAFVAYCLQLVLVVLKKGAAERWITVAAAPVSLVLLTFAWFSVRNEIKWGMVVFIGGLFGGAGYFTYKMYKIWTGRTGAYQEVYKSLTVFTILALCLLFATFIMTIRCLMNFDIGLKNAMTRTAEERKLAKESGIYSNCNSSSSSNLATDGGMDISAPFPQQPFHHYRGPSKRMLPLRSNSTLQLERHNPRLSLD